MKNLMDPEIGMPLIKALAFQGKENPACSIDDAAKEQAQEGNPGQSGPKLGNSENADPAHADVEHGRKPFGTGTPGQLDHHAAKGNDPDRDQ